MTDDDIAGYVAKMFFSSFSTFTSDCALQMANMTMKQQVSNANKERDVAKRRAKQAETELHRLQPEPAIHKVKALEARLQQQQMVAIRRVRKLQKDLADARDELTNAVG